MGTVDVFHSRRTNYAECKYWIREENKSFGNANEYILKNVPTGSFYAKEVSPRDERKNQSGGVFLYNKNTITLESDDDLSEIKPGCLVLYNGHCWRVDDVQGLVHRKESQFNIETDYKYIVSLKR